jgi:hypothetical protein
MKTFIKRYTAGASLIGNAALLAMLAMTSILFAKPF